MGQRAEHRHLLLLHVFHQRGRLRERLLGEGVHGVPEGDLARGVGAAAGAATRLMQFGLAGSKCVAF